MNTLGYMILQLRAMGEGVCALGKLLLLAAAMLAPYALVAAIEYAVDHIL